MKISTGVCAVLMVTTIVLTGCLGVKTPPVSRPAAPALLVDYQRAGGIAGVSERLVIFDNGVAVVSNRTTSREIMLYQTDLEQISRIFNESQFPMFDGDYTSSREGADFMQYSISYNGKTVYTEDTVIPPSLQPVINEMNRLLSAGLNRAQEESPLLKIAS
jgi:hypothetical protein